MLQLHNFRSPTTRGEGVNQLLPAHPSRNVRETVAELPCRWPRALRGDHCQSVLVSFLFPHSSFFCPLFASFIRKGCVERLSLSPFFLQCETNLCCEKNGVPPVSFPRITPSVFLFVFYFCRSSSTAGPTIRAFGPSSLTPASPTSELPVILSALQAEHKSLNGSVRVGCGIFCCAPEANF